MYWTPKIRRRQFLAGAAAGPAVGLASTRPATAAEGRVDNFKHLGPALTRALALVRKGEPALIDVGPR